MTTERPLIIINPHASQGRHVGLAVRVQAWLAEHHFDAKVVECGTEQALANTFAMLTEPTRIIGAGGDGTNHRLLPYVLAGQHEYALLPMGSGNDLARALNVEKLSWQEALHVALTGRAMPMDIGQATDSENQQVRHFLGCFLLGLDGAISNATQSWKMRGPLPYVLTLLTKLPRLKAWDLALTHTDPQGQVDAQAQQPILLCSLLKTPTYGSGYPVAPMAKLNDGVLHNFVLPRVSRSRFMALFLRMTRGKHIGAASMRYQPVQKLEVRSPSYLSLSADGEVIDWRTRAVTIQVLPKALPIVANYGAALQ